MKFRHELKHEINRADMMILRSRLNAVMKRDEHSLDGVYKIRTLYFDNPQNRALREKIDGVNNREKFRIRYYNGDLSFIKLEKKCKINGLCLKYGCNITKEECEKILSGDINWLKTDSRGVLNELFFKMKNDFFAPKVIVDYTREAFTYSAGNVRVTLDYDIRTGIYSTDFLNPDTVTVPAGDAPIILEVKWDEFLPDIIRDAVNLTARREAAFSKYAQCRIYG